MSLCAPPLGDGRGIRKIPLEMSDIRQFTPVVLFATLPYRSARVVFVYDKDRFFSGSILVSVNLVVFLCPGCAAGGMGGEVPILDKLESFVVNALQYVVSGVGNKKTPRFTFGSFLFCMYRNARLHFYPLLRAKMQ